MIESINQAGGAGGGVQSVVAGTGITVDNTDPENPIVNSAGIDTDEKAKVSANDTTAGYLNGKLVAGSGIAFTENNNGGNETLGIAVSNLDASAITTGTIATARLGTGTASSSTYLRGDQTWASVSAGDTTYAITTQDAENTTAQRDAVSFVIPANSLSDYELVRVSILLQTFQNSAINPAYLTHRWKINGTLTGGSYSTTYSTLNTVYITPITLFLWKEGANLRLQRTTPTQRSASNYLGWNSRYTSTGFDGVDSATPSFTSDITIGLVHQWDAANPSIFSRVLIARAVKLSGQYA